MGQKVNPNSFRLIANKDRNWNLKTYCKKNRYISVVRSNILIRDAIKKHYSSAQISKIISEVSNEKIVLHIHCRRPGVIVRSSGAGIEDMKKLVAKISNIKDTVINIHEVKYPDLEAVLVANSIASQLEKRISFRKAMKRAIQSSMKQGANGIKIVCAGRLGGAEIARAEKYMEGKVPLHTIRSDIDYARAEAHTVYGVIGIKVWLCRPEKMKRVRHSSKSKERFV